jgi:hypothetical protein
MQLGQYELRFRQVFHHLIKNNEIESAIFDRNVFEIASVGSWSVRLFELRNVDRFVVRVLEKRFVRSFTGPGVQYKRSVRDEGSKRSIFLPKPGSGGIESKQVPKVTHETQRSSFNSRPMATRPRLVRRQNLGS